MNDEGNEKKENLYDYKKIVSVLLVGIIYAAFIGLELGRIQAIADFNYRLHEMLFIPVNLAIFTVPLLSVVYLVLLVKSLKYKTQKLAPKRRIKVISVVLSLAVIFAVVGYQVQEVSTTGVYEITEKYQKGSKYYILAQDKEIRISRNEYYLIDLNEKYMVGFLWNKNTPGKGKLEIIEPAGGN